MTAYGTAMVRESDGKWFDVELCDSIEEAEAEVEQLGAKIFAQTEQKFRLRVVEMNTVV